jgi:hypothetical protein
VASEDRILKILLQLQSDVSGLNPAKSGIGDIKKSLDDTAKSAFSLQDAFKFAGAEEGLRRTLDFIKEIPGQIEEGVKKGIEFQAQLQQIQTSIAGVLRQNAPDFFSDFDKANQTAADTIDKLKAKANELGIGYEAMFEAYQHSVNSMFAGGVTNIQKQIDLITILNRAMQTFGLGAQQTARDVADVLQGMASRTVGGRQLAAAFGISPEELDEQVRQAKTLGQLFEFFASRTQALQEAGRAMGQTFTGVLTTMRNELLDLEGEAAKPVMQPLQQAIQQLTEAMKSPEVRVAMQEVGGFIANLASGFSALAQNIAGASAQLGQFAGLASNPVFSFLVGGAAKSATSLAQGNLIVDLTKQSQAAITLLQNARDTKDVVAAQIQLEQTNFSIKQQIGQVDGVDRQQLEGQLKVNQDILKNLQGVAGTAAQITPRHLDNKKALEAQKETQAEINLLLAQASGDKEAVAAERSALAYDKKLKSLIAAGVPEKEATAEAQKYADAVRQAALATDARKNSQRDLTELLREENLILAQIRGSQQLIQQNPFLSADAKQTLLFESYSRELVTLNAEIQKQQEFVKNTALDPAQLEEARAKLQQLQLEMGLLAQKMPSLTFGGGIQSGLVAWANSFGTTSHQIGDTIKGTINSALQGTNQLLLDAAFRTGNWKQTLVGVERQIATLFLDMLEKMALQQALQLAGISSTTTAQTASGAAIAAAHAPAAAATSISSYGVAALIGEAAAIAAIFAIMAALGGGFRKGGYTGDGNANEIAGPAHKKEFIFTEDETSKLGVPFLSSLARSAGGVARFGGGGLVNNPYGIGNPPGSAILPPEAYPHGIAPPGYPVARDDPYASLPPDASGVAPGQAYSDLPVSTGSPARPFDNMSASRGIVPGGIDIRGDWPNPDGEEPSPGSRVSPTVPTSRYPGLRGPRSNDWASNAARASVPYGFHPGGGGVDPGYIDPISAGAFIPGLINWNGPGAPNKHDPELSGGASLAAKFGIAGLARSGKWRGKQFAEGGAVDSVPAMLTPREFVHPVDAVDHYGLDFMEAVRKKRFPVSHMSAGGFVSDFATGAAGGATSSVRDQQFLLFLDPDEIRRHALNNPQAEIQIVDLIRRKRTQIG